MKNINLNHLKFTIAGAGRSGLSCAKLLKKFNANVFVTEEKNFSPETEKFLKDANVPYEQNGHSFDKIIKNTDILVISPGILLSSPLVLQAKKNNIPILSEIEVASWLFPENLICFGITGTNGKSTTTHYLASLLQLHNKAIACGNIGKPVSEVILELYEENSQKNIENIYLSIELSSYQLETIYSLRPLCTCFLNLQNDHLGRYENMTEYLKAKWRLVLLTRDDGLTIIDKHVLENAVKLGLPLPKCEIFIIDNSTSNNFKVELRKNNKLLEKLKNGINLPIPLYKELKNLNISEIISPFSFHSAHVHYNANTNSANINIINKNKSYLWEIKNSCLNGKHNIINILTASLIAEFAKLPRSLIAKQWEKETTNYIHLPNRLENIGKENQVFVDTNKNKKQVNIINDSKATNVESTLVALQSFNKPIRLLLGGEPKGDSYLPIANFIGKNIVGIYLFGKAGANIYQQLNEYKEILLHVFPNMLAAANQALLECKNGEIILLSPACSSFDEFKDYEHRGHVFRTWAISCFEENNL